MPTVTARPTTADLLYAHDHAVEQIERLSEKVANMPLLDAADDQTIQRLFGELDDLADAVDGLTVEFKKNIRG
ncbi:hypothetical protein [Crateriforma spongiae]|uniref:hypothetical protein n=1 Tax=Crateriforma spongiae TaxID=2724528 RepID=UPI00144815C4|nr:hypothetical protein [Crateriforma spongiae]